VSIELTLIGRQGCHLCEVAQGDLAQVIARFAAEHPDAQYVVNDLSIDDDASFAKYTDEVPVLLLNGKQIAFWRIEQERVLALLEAEL
jgi:uncharacterized protein YehS (DUF1456 family)